MNKLKAAIIMVLFAFGVTPFYPYEKPCGEVA